jgi:small subunit ribosomal protein S8
MTMTDPISDMLTRIRNANTVFKERVEIPASKAKLSIARILKEEGFIKNYKLIKNRKQGLLRLYLRYGEDRERVITGLKRISKPGLRVYRGYGDVPKVLNGMGIAVVSTSSGMMTDRDCRRKGVGGEVLCFVW